MKLEQARITNSSLFESNNDPIEFKNVDPKIKFQDSSFNRVIVIFIRC